MALAIDDIVAVKGYIGWLKSDANPKTRDWWLDVKKGVVVVNPEMVATRLDEMREKVQKALEEGKKVLLIYEKSMLREEIEEIASKKGVYYLNYKVPWGILTNFETILKRVKSMNQLREFVNSPEFKLLTKKEQLTKKRELEKLEIVYKGIKDLDSKPDLVIVLDGMYKPSLLDEIKRAKVDYLVVTPPSLNRRLDEDKVLVTNTYSYKTLKFVLSYIFS